jgi:hypothetical protein
VAAPLEIELSCPKCGAPFAVDDSVVTSTCAHCASLLVLSAPERPEIYVAEERLRTPEEVQELVVEYRVQAHRAEVVDAGSRDEDEPGPPELWVQLRLRQFEDELRAKLRLLEAHRVQVPYWHVTGKILQATLGRRADGPKIVRLRAWGVEHTVPAYDTEAANLRDRGLRLHKARVRPLRAKELAAQGPFLPWRPLTPRSYREIDRWKGQDLEPRLDRVARHAAFLPARPLLVYRPYWLAHLVTDRGQEWILADGSFGTIAGYPAPDEIRHLRRLADADPLGSTGESFRRVTVAASRCPDCGHEAHLETSAHVSLCASCHRALRPEPEGIRLQPYDHARSDQVTLDGDYLPFWRYDVTVTAPGAAPSKSLEDYVRQVFPQGAPKGFTPQGRHLWVPAFRLLETATGDDAFHRLVHWVHGAPPAVAEGKIPLGGTCRGWGATLGEPEARALAPFVLFALHGESSSARLTTRTFSSAIAKAEIALANPRLVMVPFTRAGDGFVALGTGPAVASWLVEGGPEVEAQRATVHRARAAEPPEKFPDMSF